jgi:uncharacterized membrane protein YidH (DUF202 family)
MSKPDFKELSRQNWESGFLHPSNEQLALGCQQRQADAAERSATAAERTAKATEAMAVNFVQMQTDLARYKRWYEDERKTTEKQRATIINLKGQVTKAKKKAVALQDGQRV